MGGELLAPLFLPPSSFCFFYLIRRGGVLLGLNARGARLCGGRRGSAKKSVNISQGKYEEHAASKHP